MNDTFVITYEQLQPQLFLSAGPSATKHGPNNQYPWLTQGYSSNHYVLNSYHLEEDINVVGNKELSCAKKIKAYNMAESQRMVTSMPLSASILNYHFLCVLCSHIEMSSASNVFKFILPFFEEFPLVW
jgi:hypothetical protein